MFLRHFLQPFTGWRMAGLLVLLAGGLTLCISNASRADVPLLEEINFAAQAEEQPQSGLRQINMTIAGKRYRVEVAETPEQSEKGLMYRTSLPDNHGMLFLFEPPRVVNFWMKNTKIPLDMVFLDKGTVLHVARNVRPCLTSVCATYSSQFPVDMVVELPAGTADKNKIIPGATAIVNVHRKTLAFTRQLYARNHGAAPVEGR